MRRPIRRFRLWVAMAALAIGSRAAHARGDEGIPKPIEEVLRWLPADTQTVVVAQGPTKFLEAFGLGQGEDGIHIGSWPPAIARDGNQVGSQATRSNSSSRGRVDSGPRRGWD